MRRVLVAEDDPHILRVICLWLSRQGYEVLEARNGTSALGLARLHRPEVLITDVNMPGLDGVALVETLTKSGHCPRGIVVLTNRWDHREIAQNLAKYGAQVVPKPFSPSRLAELIARLGQEQTAPASSDEPAQGAENE